MKVTFDTNCIIDIELNGGAAADLLPLLVLHEGTRLDIRVSGIVASERLRGGGLVSWGPGVSFGGGVSIMGVPIDPRTQLPMPNNQVTTQITIWVDFKFKDNGLSVMPLVEDSIKKVESVFCELQKHL